MEDTDATKDEIASLSNDAVLEAVVLFTKQRGYNMQEYISNICNNPIAKVVKAADRLHNLQSVLVTSQEFKRRYILETLDWYIDSLLMDFTKLVKFEADMVIIAIGQGPQGVVVSESSVIKNEKGLLDAEAVVFSKKEVEEKNYIFNK